MTDAKVMLPKQGKTDYSSVRAYRPVTLIGKVLEQIVTRRLVWKLEVEHLLDLHIESKNPVCSPYLELQIWYQKQEVRKRTQNSQ